jgi:hypothetical protein
MRTLSINHPAIVKVTLVSELGPTDDNIDVWAEMSDGRTFGFTVFAIKSIERLIGSSLSFVSPGMLVVRELSEASILEAVVEAERLGIEQFGVLQS